MRFFLTSLFILTLFIPTSNGEENKELSFSDTQTLGKNEAQFVKKYTPKLIKLSENDLKKIPLPHKNKSKETKEELKALLALQKSRKATDVELIKKERQFCRFEFSIYSLGENKLLDNLLASVFLDVSYYIFKLKVQYDRVRPNYLEPKLRPAIENPAHPAYPSGHGGQSMITALVLSEVFPNKKEELVEYAKSIGSNRELAGVHYESDTLSGQKVAEIYFQKLKKDPAFQKKIHKIRSSILNKKPAFTEAACENFMELHLSPYR